MSDPKATPEALKAASDACTRSGAFAVTLTLLLVFLLRPWVDRQVEVAFSRYVMWRMNLSLLIDRIDEDPSWSELKQSNPSLESGMLASVPKQIVIPPTDTPPPPEKETKETEPHRPGWGPSPPGPHRPAAPGALTLSLPIDDKIPEFKAIIETLDALNDPVLLEQSSEYSNFANFSIVRWEQKRYDQIYRNVDTVKCKINQIQMPNASDASPGYSSTFAPDAFVQCLSFADVRELAAFERPQSSTPLVERIERDPGISLGSLPRSLIPLTVAAELLLFLTLMYFGAWEREIVRVGPLITEGTFFGAFSRSSATKFLLLFLVWIPSIATIAIAFVSRTAWSIAGALLVAASVIFVYSVLHQERYFFRHRIEHAISVNETESTVDQNL